MSDKTEHANLPEAFAALGVRNSILRGLADAKFVEPSEIQRLVIPEALKGHDILGQARTGTGKTAAFGIPILQMADRDTPVQALMLVPTRELAIQVEEELRRLAKHTLIRIVSLVGGQKLAGQVKALSHNPHIAVGTPGRVMDLHERRLLDFDNIRFVVLDEVDRMLDIGFREDIRRILARVRDAVRDRRQDAQRAPDRSDDAVDQADESQGTSGDESQPENVSRDMSKVQTIFVSATFSDEIEKLARKYMRDPVKLVATGADESPTVDNIEQYYLTVQPWDKYRLLRALMKQEQPELAIIFCRTKHGADKLARNLTVDGIECMEIHGNLRQSKRDKVMKGFRGHKFDVLVATDLASRGIDVAGITHIINYDIPEDSEVYVHRIGRTARMGAEGKAYTFVTRDQGEELTRVEALINMLIPKLEVEGFEARPEPARRPGDEGPPGRGGRGGGGRGGRPVRPMMPLTPPPGATQDKPEEPAAPKRRTMGSHIKPGRRR